MTREQMEFLISQFLDGMLSTEEEASVRELLASSEEARQILAEYSKLDSVIKSARGMPAVKWDLLAERISACVAKEVIAEAPVEQPAPVAEELEFAITQYLDGTLPIEQKAGLEKRLENDPVARRVLEEHRGLNELMKYALPSPAMKWDEVSQAIFQAVAQQPQIQAVSEEDEFAISEYLDGSLSVEDQAVLERRMENEPALREAMKQYMSLDRIVREGMATPAVKWDVLAERLSESIDAGTQRQRMFIGNWIRQPMRLAAAAVLLIALGLAIVVALTRGGGPQRTLTIEVNRIEQPEGPKVASVDFDMSPSLAQSGTDWYAAGDVVSMPTRLDVAISRPVLNDGPSPF